MRNSDDSTMVGGARSFEVHTTTLGTTERRTKQTGDHVLHHFMLEVPFLGQKSVDGILVTRSTSAPKLVIIVIRSGGNLSLLDSHKM